MRADERISNRVIYLNSKEIVDDVNIFEREISISYLFVKLNGHGLPTVKNKNIKNKKLVYFMSPFKENNQFR